jgi:hypothetical protein
MISDEQLLSYNKCGWIPGPEEDEESFSQRISFGKELFEDPFNFFEKKESAPPFSLEKKLLKPRWSWTSTYLLDLYDFSPAHILAFFHNHELSPFQAGSCWIFEVERIPITFIQLREALIKGSFLKIYSLEELLAHEATHAARAAFREPEFEEFFAYATSSSFLRRFLGPLAGSPKGLFFFGSTFCCTLLFEWLSFFFQGPFVFLSLLFGWGLFFSLAYVFFRLLRKRWIFRRAYQNLFAILKERKKTMATLFRLKDLEIKNFSRMNKEEIVDFVMKEPSLRYRLLRGAYFKM